MRMGAMASPGIFRHLRQPSFFLSQLDDAAAKGIKVGTTCSRLDFQRNQPLKSSINKTPSSGLSDAH